MGKEDGEKEGKMGAGKTWEADFRKKKMAGGSKHGREQYKQSQERCIADRKKCASSSLARVK